MFLRFRYRNNYYVTLSYFCKQLQTFNLKFYILNYINNLAIEETDERERKETCSNNQHADLRKERNRRSDRNDNREELEVQAKIIKMHTIMGVI